MDKVAYLRERLVANNRVLYALLQCLTPQEACSLLDLDFGQSSSIRERIIERIRADMTNRFEDFHHELVENLISRLDSLPASKLGSCAYCIERFCRACCHHTKQRIIRLFLKASRKDFRNRAYQILKFDWNPEIEPEVVSVWHEKLDEKCTLLLLEKSDSDFIQENFDLLYDNIPGLQYMAKLFERLLNVGIDKIEKLKEEDSITYAYVLARLGLSLAESEAMQIYEDNKQDHRSGILIWAYGRLKLWNVLIHIESDPAYKPFS